MERPFPAYQGDEPYIFVSYAHEDAELVYPEIQWLKDQGFNIWYDEGISPGRRWSEELATALRDSALFLYFGTPNSVNSRHCLDEINLALDEDKATIAVHLAETELTPGLRLRLGSHQAILKYQLTAQEYRDKLVSVLIRDGQRSFGGEQTERTTTVKTSNSRVLWLAGGLTVIGLLAVGLVYVWPTDEPARVSTPRSAEQQEGVPPATSEERPSIAVLPFVNMSSDPEQEYFSDGISEDILNGLVKLSRIRVIARTSSFQFKGQNQDIRKIGEMLGVDHVLEGSVRRSGDRIRVTAQLNSTRDGSHIWSDQFDRELTDVFMIQDEITREIINALQVRLLAADFNRTKHQDKGSLEAWNELILGRQQYSLATYTSLEAAVRHFQNAIDLDPDYAEAYAALADTYIRMIKWGVKPDEPMVDLIKPLVDKAMSLDDQLPEVHVSTAFLRYTEGDRRAAERSYLRALELSESNALAIGDYGWFLLSANRKMEALQAFERGITLDPLSVDANANMSEANLFLGRLDEHARWSQHLLELAPDDARSHAEAGWGFIELGRLDLAYESILKCALLDPRDPDCAMNVMRASLNLGDAQAANEWTEKAIARNPDHMSSRFARTLLAYYLGDETGAATLSIGALNSGLPIRFDHAPVFLRIMRDAELKHDRFAAIEARYFKVFPSLADEGPLVGDSVHWVWPSAIAAAALDLAFVKKRAGDLSGVDRLVRKVSAYLRDDSEVVSVFLDAELLELQGEHDAALLKLRSAIDRGWRDLWWWHTERNSNLAELHNDPRYRAMIDEVKADMAEQLARIRVMKNASVSNT